MIAVAATFEVRIPGKEWRSATAATDARVCFGVICCNDPVFRSCPDVGLFFDFAASSKLMYLARGTCIKHCAESSRSWCFPAGSGFGHVRDLTIDTLVHRYDTSLASLEEGAHRITSVRVTRGGASDRRREG